MHGIDELSANGLYDVYINSLDVISINGRPHDVRALHELSVTGLKRLSVNVHPHDSREYVDVTSQSDLPSINFLGP